MKTLLNKDAPILRKIAEAIPDSDFKSLWVKELVEDLFKIMAHKGAVGVAAPQIGISKRIIVFGTSYSKRINIESLIPDTALINPQIKILSDSQQTGYEGCLNCDELMGLVPRAMDIEYSGFDINGNIIIKQVSGLEARILQHEVDHLNGLLFLDHIKDIENLTTLTELHNKI